MMFRALPVLAIALACAACAPRKLVERVTLLEERNDQLTARTTSLEKKMTRVEALVDEVEAAKAYTREVADKLTAIRDRYARLLDEQNQRIDDGRKAYISVLQAQRVSLQQRLRELDRAIADLHAPPPRPRTPASGTLPAPPPPLPSP